MELLVATAIGTAMAAGIYLTLQRQSFPVVLGLTLISYAVNMILAATGRLVIGAPPVLAKTGTDSLADPLPQALVLTAIVISFAMSAVLLILAVQSFAARGDDRIDPPQGGSQEGGHKT